MITAHPTSVRAAWLTHRAHLTGLLRRMPATDTDTELDSHFFYLPVFAPMHTQGMLVIDMGNQHWVMVPEQRKQLDTFATLAAFALERMHNV